MSAGPFDPEDRRLDAEVRAAVRLRQDAAGGEGDHLSAEQLADYSLGLHRPEEEELIQEHLTYCAECAEAVLGLADEVGEDGAGRVSPPAVERERSRSGRQGGRVSPSPMPVRRGIPAWAFAASLAGCAALLLWAFELRHELAEERAPSAQVVVADLAPAAEVRARGEGDAVQVRLPAGAERLVLLLNLGDLRTFPRYRLELAGRGGEVVWRQDHVPRGEMGAFSLDLSTSALSPGAYEVRLHGLDGERATRLAVYHFELAR